MGVLKLPMATPTIRAFLHLAYQFSILGCYENTKPWMFMNFIQLVSEDKEAMPVYFYNPDDFGYHFNILTPFFEYQILSRSFIHSQKINLQTLIKDSIKSGNYLYFYINERYIPGTSAYEANSNFNHPIMLHGIDAESNKIFYYGYDKNALYAENRIGLEALSTAYFDNTYDFPRFEDRLYIFHVTSDKGLKLEISLKSIVEQLEMLRDSVIHIRNVIDFHKDIQFIYGLNVLNRLADSLRLMSKKLLWIDLRPLHLLMEHKTLMVLRLEYIEQINPEIHLVYYINEYKGLANSYMRLRNSLLKNIIACTYNQIEKIANKLLILQNIEYELLDRLISYLRYK